MIVAALTGSIAMGKSETAKMFAERGVPVFDSDRAVHALYARGGDAVAAIQSLIPDAVVDGAVDRQRLSAAVMKDEALLQRIEQVVHPLVRRTQDLFIAGAKSANVPLVVLDIPLLFETGRDSEVDRIIVVSAPPEIQRSRALQRPGMTPQKLDFILSKQLNDAEKRRRADYVIDTSRGLDDAGRQVDAVAADLIARETGQ
jgi:dephospho-CoA kinase